MRTKKAFKALFITFKGLSSKQIKIKFFGRWESNFKTKTNSKYFLEYSDKAIIPLILVMHKTSGYVKTFKVEDKNSKMISFHIYYEKLFKKYNAIWTKIEDLKILN